MAQQTLEEATKFNANLFNLKFGTKEFNDMCSKMFGGNPKHKNNNAQEFNSDAKWQQERMYSEEDLLSAFEAGMMFIGEDKGSFKEWFERFKNK